MARTVLDPAVSGLDTEPAALDARVRFDVKRRREAAADQREVVGVEADEPLVVRALEHRDCALDAHCMVKPHMSVVRAKVRGALGAVSLQELAR